MIARVPLARHAYTNSLLQLHDANRNDEQARSPRLRVRATDSTGQLGRYKRHGEAAVKVVTNWVIHYLVNRTFTSFDDLDEAVAERVEPRNHKIPFRGEPCWAARFPFRCHTQPPWHWAGSRYPRMGRNGELRAELPAAGTAHHVRTELCDSPCRNLAQSVGSSAA